jgi:hypothetical protein
LPSPTTVSVEFEGWEPQIGFLLVALASFGGGAWLIRFALQRRRIPSDAILVDFRNSQLRRVNGRKVLGTCPFKELGKLAVQKVDVTVDRPGRRRRTLRVYEWVVSCQGLPGVPLYRGGSPEDAEEMVATLRGYADGSRKPGRSALDDV